MIHNAIMIWIALLNFFISIPSPVPEILIEPAQPVKDQAPFLKPLACFPDIVYTKSLNTCKETVFVNSFPSLKERFVDQNPITTPFIKEEE